MSDEAPTLTNKSISCGPQPCVSVYSGTNAVMTNVSMPQYDAVIAALQRHEHMQMIANGIVLASLLVLVALRLYRLLKR